MDGFNLSYVLIAFYTMLCILAGFQLVRIIYYRHNRASFQFGFLMFCFLWTSLRVVYFVVFYPPLVSDINCWIRDLVYLVPVTVQFATFTLLLVFYAYWVHKTEWEGRFRVMFVTGSLIINLALVILLLVWVGFDCTIDDRSDSSFNLMTMLQEVFSGCIFLGLTIVLSWYGWRLYKQTNGSLNTQFIRVRHRANSTRQIILITSIIVLIFLTRAVHDFLAVSPRYRQWLGHPLQVFEFFCYMFWEVLPTFMVLIFFRRIPKTNYGNGQQRVIHAASSAPSPAFKGKEFQPPRPLGQAHLFDDLQRYDSDEDRFFRSPSWSAVFTTPSASLHNSASGEHVGAALLSQYGKNASSTYRTPLNPHQEDTDNS